jgi:N-acyl-phosphatidylethanolamine-hydrolysing phospholipase D
MNILKYLLFPIALVTLLSSCAQPQFNKDHWKQQAESTQAGQLYSKHVRDGVYFNPWIADTRRSFSSILTWRLSAKQHYTEKEETFLPKVLEDTKERILKNIDSDFILWIGHGSFLIKTGEHVWLLDPMFSHRAVLPARFTPPALTAGDINELFPQVNVIISHSHYDHLDSNSIKALSDSTHFYVPMGLKKTLRNWQPEAKITEMDWWDKLTLTPGYELHSLPAQHWSMRAFDSANSSLWASYMIVTPEQTIYFGGDSGYFKGYREFRKKYPKIDYALIPTTAYHPRWFMHYAHMNVEEAVQAFFDLEASYFIPTQWGTFRLGDNPPGYPALDLKRTIKRKQLNPKQFLIMNIGQLLLLDS